MNGKVERAQQTVLKEFFAIRGTVSGLSEELHDQLACWQHYYNWDRIHGSIGMPPIDKVSLLRKETPFWDDVINNYSPVKERQYALSKLIHRKTLN